MIAVIIVIVVILVVIFSYVSNSGRTDESFKKRYRPYHPYEACAQGTCQYCRSGTYAGITNRGGGYCCPTTNTDSGWFPHADSAASFWSSREYCTGLPVGMPCVTDAMCGDGSAGSCSGELGWTSGTCVNAALEAMCNAYYKACQQTCENNVNGNGDDYQLMETGAVLAVCLAQCDTAVTACRQ